MISDHPHRYQSFRTLNKQCLWRQKVKKVHRSLVPNVEVWSQNVHIYQKCTLKVSYIYIWRSQVKNVELYLKRKMEKHQFEVYVGCRDMVGYFRGGRGWGGGGWWVVITENVRKFSENFRKFRGNFRKIFEKFPNELNHEKWFFEMGNQKFYMWPTGKWFYDHGESSCAIAKEM